MEKTDEPKSPSERLLSLDVYRGMVMLLLATSGLGLARAANQGEGAFAKFIVFQGTHPEWNSQFAVFGVSLWDLIQPAFMFIVGVSMPFSYEKRARLGESYSRRLRHAWTRAILLTLLGVFLQSLRKPDTYWIFTNVLSQIGLGYGFLFFLVGKSWRTQFTTGALVLVVYYILMILLPRGLESWRIHFENGTSFPQVFDQWFLNLFPREEEFTGHAYSTLNFVPSFVTMLMGLMAGQVLKNREVSEARKLKQLWIAAGILLLAGAIAGLTFCPVVKKLWTPSWTLFSGGYVVGLLALSYWIIDVKKWNGWVFPFVVVGLNPLAMYLMGMISKGFVRDNLHRHLPDFLFAGPKAPIVDACLIALVFWLVLWWMFRNKVFLRL
jgi:predicted acyltransferase